MLAASASCWIYSTLTPLPIPDRAVRLRPGPASSWRPGKPLVPWARHQFM